VIRREPHLFGRDRSRWRLTDLLEVCDWLSPISQGGLSKLLSRLGVSYQRGRDHVHSPDPLYPQKRAFIQQILAEAQVSAGRVVALFQDEVTYYRQPTLAWAYTPWGEQPRARRSHQANTATRVTGVLNPVTGRVDYWHGSRISTDRLVLFYQQVCQAYPKAERLYLIQDNWPVHYHPDVRVALKEHESPWPWKVPKHWPTQPSAAAKRRYGALSLPIQIVSLPTYASWLNPIEKLWRWLKQDVLHLHRLSDQLTELRAAVNRFLDRFAAGSIDLLRYVGLPVSV
jgi:transposase